jgi:ribosomal protein S18 acetylase RimI-like enzyme
MECEILPITEQAIPGYRAAIDTVAKERKYFAFEEAADLDVITEIVKRNIACRYPQYVVMSEGLVSGWCEVIPYNMWVTDPHSGTLCMGLLPAVRGKGVGRRLILHVINAAFADQFSRIELMVRETNEPARMLYSSVGFALEGVHRKVVFNGTGYDNLHSMALIRR